MAWPRIILHADLDAFYASVEQLDDPTLRGKPVIVGGTTNRGVVSAASYEARVFGVHSAMPTVQARRQCPEGIFLPPRFERYTELSRQVMAIFDTFSPSVEPLSLDEAFLDMTGAEALFGAPAEMGRRLKADVHRATGLTVSVGVATTKYVAKVASDFDKPDGLTIVPLDAVTTFLWPQPVTRLWGVGKRAAPRLEELGLRTIGDVARAPLPLLTGHLGSLGEHIHRLANGEDPRAVEPDREAKSVGAEVTLERDVSGAAAICQHLRRSADRVAPRLRRHGLLARGVRVKLKTSGFQLLTRQAPLPHPTDAAREIYTAACALLDEFDLTLPYRLVGLAAFHLQAAGQPVQGELFEDGEVGSHLKTRRLERTLDDLRDKFGRQVVQRASDLDAGPPRDTMSPADLRQKRRGVPESGEPARRDAPDDDS